MKSAGDNNASAFLLVAGHGLSLAFFCFALHLTAAGCRIFSDEMGLFLELPGYGRLVISTDRVMQSWWFLLVPLAAFALWLDWRIALRLLAFPKTCFARFWAYSVFVTTFLNTACCVGWFGWWMSWVGRLGLRPPY